MEGIIDVVPGGACRSGMTMVVRDKDYLLAVSLLAFVDLRLL